jgi:hypothetical protein
VNAALLMHCWQDLNKDAASGVDGLTAEKYAANLEGNIAELAERVKAKRYRAKLVRRVYIRKENGKERPLGIPALEDKLVQLACAKLLGAIYEEDFLDGSHGDGMCIQMAESARRQAQYNRRTGCGKTARPGLCRGRRVTGAPTARALATRCSTWSDVSRLALYV